MNFTQEEAIQFADEYENFLDRKKELAKDIKEYVDGFCETHEILKKRQFIMATKSYIKWKEDRAAFLDDSNTFDQFVDILTGEKCIEKLSENEL